MKKTFFLSMLIASAMICSCQKQNALAEAQLAQRKTELDAREETLIQREKAVDEREKAVAEREKAVADTRIIQSQRQAPDAAQAEAERLDAAHAEAERQGREAEKQRTEAEKQRTDAADRQKRIQQLPPELRALIPDRSRMKADKPEHNPATQQPGGVRTQPSLEDAERKKKMISEMASSQPEVPDVNAISPSASPTPQ
jgi:chromosome segregation ATPase